MQPKKPILESEPAGPYCNVCGSELEHERCDACDGDGFFDYETLQEVDPLWYQPGDTETCETCGGDGGWWICWVCRHAA